MLKETFSVIFKHREFAAIRILYRGQIITQRPFFVLHLSRTAVPRHFGECCLRGWVIKLWIPNVSVWLSVSYNLNFSEYPREGMFKSIMHLGKNENRKAVFSPAATSLSWCCCSDVWIMHRGATDVKAASNWLDSPPIRGVAYPKMRSDCIYIRLLTYWMKPNRFCWCWP